MTDPASLPPGLAARARDFLRSPHPPVPARPAATVVLVRDAPAGPEAYLMRRVAGMAFAGGMHVFPGGGVDPRDADQVPWAGPDAVTWAERLSADAGLTRALVCAAVRETFEESGVLLAGWSAGASRDVVADTTGAAWEADRQALLSRELAFSDLLRRRGLVLRADLLRPWAHWITPEFEERRYDTRFFVAALPAGQRTRDVGGEADRVAWWRPGDAVASHQRGELAMLPPTVATLQELSSYDAVAAVLEAADARRIVPVLPRAALDGDDVQLVYP